MFIGYVPKEKPMYENMARMDYRWVFKQTSRGTGGKIKGNTDAELVIHAMIELENYQNAVIVTGDGDLHCLVKHLIKLNYM